MIEAADVYLSFLFSKHDLQNTSGRSTASLCLNDEELLA